ncbi:hypothetical protein ACFE04_029878 [Oxalis oulophora]
MDVQDKHRTGEQVPNDDGMSAPQNVPAVDGPPINMRPWIFHVRAFMIEYLFARLIQRTPHPDDEAKRTYLKGRAKHLDDSSNVQTAQGGQQPVHNEPARYSFSVDPTELLPAHNSMLEKISTMYVQMQPQPISDAEKMRRKANAKTLEVLFLLLHEAYMNTETLVVRFQFLIDHGFIPAPTSLRTLAGPPLNLLRRRINAFNMNDY